MSNTREKLIELLTEIDGVCPNEENCYHCKYDNEEYCFAHSKADFLISHGVTVQQWIPVTERLPKEGEEVLVFGYWHEKFQPLMCYLSPHRKGEWFTTVSGQQVYKVTHWMPLPENPKEE